MATENREIMEKLQQIEERLERIEREERPRSLREVIGRLVPREVRQHLRAARREQLLAVDAWLHHLIQRLEEEERHEPGRGRRRISVE